MVQLRIFVSLRKEIRRLSYEEKGQLLDAMLAYAEDKTLLPLSGKADVIWDVIQERIDAQHNSYEKMCAVNKKNIQKRYESLRTDTNRYESSQIQVQVQDQIQVKSLKSSENVGTKFHAPTVEEVREYCYERENNVDPEHFVAYYESNGWKVGKNSMKDWKAAVRSWEQRDGKTKTTNQFLQMLREEGGNL